MKYFRYNLDELKQSSDRKLLTISRFSQAVVVHHVVIN